MCDRKKNAPGNSRGLQILVHSIVAAIICSLAGHSDFDDVIH
jgi:hypothetical protein